MSLEERMQLTGRKTPSETTSVAKAYFNLTVCVVASALLSIPFSFDKTGFTSVVYEQYDYTVLVVYYILLSMFNLTYYILVYYIQT